MTRRRGFPRALHLVGLGLVVALFSLFGGRRRGTDAPDLVSLTATPDRSAVVAGVATSMVVRLQVAAAERDDEAELGVNLGLLLDTSGSMAGEPIEQARAAVHALVEQLRPHNRLTVVTFDSRAQLVLPPTSIDDVDLDALHGRIDEIRAEGTTDLVAGLGALLTQLAANPTAGDLDRIVIVGDGVPNDPGPIAGQVEAARQAGYAITTLGVGLDYDEVLLGKMARDSGGRFHHVELGAELADSFSAELLGAQRQVAANVWLQLATGPGVTISRVVGYSPAMSGVHQHGVVLAELAEGESQEVFVELAIDPAKPGATLELLDAVVAYDDRTSGAGRFERRAFVSMPTSEDTSVLAMRCPEVELGAVAAQAAAATIEAIALNRKGDIAKADALLEHNEEALRRSLADNSDQVENQADLQQQQLGITKLRGEFRSVPRFAAVASDGRSDPNGDEAYRRAAKQANSAAVDLLQAHK